MSTLHVCFCLVFPVNFGECFAFLFCRLIRFSCVSFCVPCVCIMCVHLSSSSDRPFLIPVHHSVHLLACHPLCFFLCVSMPQVPCFRFSGFASFPQFSCFQFRFLLVLSIPHLPFVYSVFVPNKGPLSVQTLPSYPLSKLGSSRFISQRSACRL